MGLKDKTSSIPLILIILLAVAFITMALNIQITQATESICIKADGSIDPPTSLIYRVDDTTYAFSDDIASSIVVERSNIIIKGNGFTLQGSGSGYGLVLYAILNVSIQDVNIKGFNVGIFMNSASYNTISGNNITDNSDSGIFLEWFAHNNSIYGNNMANNTFGIFIHDSANNTISGNGIMANSNGVCLELGARSTNITGNSIRANNDCGISVYSASNNHIDGNNITANECGIQMVHYSGSTDIIRNNISDNEWGIKFTDHSDVNHVYDNNFLNNTVHAHTQNSNDNWDNGIEGNYWSNYTGTDFFNGVSQNITGSDGIGDTPHRIDTDNNDNYPLVKPYTSHDLGITSVRTGKKTVGQGRLLNITVTIVNYGSETETLNVTVHANMTIVATLTDEVSLASRKSTILTFTWNTTNCEKSNYTLWACTWPHPDEADTTDNILTGDTVCVGTSPDVNDDGQVDVRDIYVVAMAYGSCPGQTNWNPECDINTDDKVDIKDFYFVCKHYGEVDL